MEVPRQLRTQFSNAVPESKAAALPAALLDLGFQPDGSAAAGGALPTGRPGRAVLHLCGKPAGRGGMQGQAVSFDVTFEPG